MRDVRRLVVALALSATGCGTTSASPDPPPSSSTLSGSSARNRKVEWVALPKQGDPAAFVRTEIERARHDEKKLVIYVGAKWCEPCQRFHQAAEAGSLDASFPDLRLIDLDHDADEAAVGGLGCGSQMIPLFSLPDATGHCTDQRAEGGIKGDGAVSYI